MLARAGGWNFVSETARTATKGSRPKKRVREFRRFRRSRRNGKGTPGTPPGGRMFRRESPTHRTPPRAERRRAPPDHEAAHDPAIGRSTASDNGGSRDPVIHSNYGIAKSPLSGHHRLRITGPPKPGYRMPSAVEPRDSRKPANSLAPRLRITGSQSPVIGCRPPSNRGIAETPLSAALTASDNWAAKAQLSDAVCH